MVYLKHVTNDYNSYCPKFYAELMRRLDTYYTEADFWETYFPDFSVRRVHQDGCLHSDKPDFIIQRNDGLADSIYFRHCGGEFRDLMMRKLQLGTGQDAVTANTGRWSGKARFIGADVVPGFEWKDKTAVQDIMICDGIVHLH